MPKLPGGYEKKERGAGATISSGHPLAQRWTSNQVRTVLPVRVRDVQVQLHDQLEKVGVAKVVRHLEGVLPLPRGYLGERKIDGCWKKMVVDGVE